MATFVYDQLSEHRVAKALVQRFGLLGLARLVRVVEECTDSGQVAMSLSDWLGVLHCAPDEFDEIRVILERCQAFTTSQDDLPTAPLMLTVGPALKSLFAPPDPATVIYNDPRTWHQWFAVELHTPRHVLESQESLSLFRRWSATHVSLAEMHQATALAAVEVDVSPAAVHRQIIQIRAARLEIARNSA